MAYGCAGSSPAFRTISKGGSYVKFLFNIEFFLSHPVKTVISVLLLHVFLRLTSLASTPNKEISIGYDEQTEENKCVSHF